MYFITEEEQLIGKTIAFTHFAQFAEAVVIVTEDKGVFVAAQDGEGHDKETRVYPEPHAYNHVFKNDWMVKELSKKGIVTKEDVAGYKRKKEEERQAWMDEQKRQKEERDRREYERLQKKFGPSNE